MKKVLFLLLILVFTLLGCSETQVTQVGKNAPQALLELQLENGGYNAHLRNAFDEPTQFSFAIQCNSCDLYAPPTVLVNENMILPLDAKEGDEFVLIAYDSKNNFYASVKP